MRKGRKKSTARTARVVEHTNFRLCHHCLHLNESSSEILRCEGCRRYLTVEPLLDYLEERMRSRDEEDFPIDADEDFVAPDAAGHETDRPPLLAGLTVRW